MEQGARANDLAGRLDGETVPVVASHVTVQTGAETTLRLYLGRAKGDPGRWLLVDMTPGLDSEHHALEYEGSTAAGALSAFDEENGYPDGAISLRVDPNPLRVQPHTRRLTTDGQTLLGSLSSKASMASLLLIVGAIAAAPFTGGGSLLVTTLVIGGATLGAAARALSQPRRSPEDRGRQQDRHRPRRLHHRDQLPQRRPGRPGDPPRPGPPRRQPRHPLPPLDHLALEGASGLLIGIDGADQIIAILESKAPPAEKSRLLLAVIANLMRAGRRRKPRDAEAETRQIRVGLPSFICRRQSDAPSSIVGESLCLNLTPHLTSRAQ